MAVGQGVLGRSVLDVPEIDRLGDRIEQRERRRSVDHAEQLTDLLALHRTYEAAGMGLCTPAFAALILSCSEHRAAGLLADAMVLERIGGLAVMAAGLLSVEQSRVAVDLLGLLDEAVAAPLFERLARRLEADREQSIVRPPGRLRELLQRWIIAADPDGYAERRRTAAEQDGDVELWRREDGLVDLVGRALSGADGQACLDRIDQLAGPTGPADTRTTGQRRRQTLVDLLTGRLALPFDPGADPDSLAGCCPPGSAAPCGANIFVHVPLTGINGESGPPPELIGHGPIDPAQLAGLLSADPILHRVWVDDHGTPVAIDETAWRPGRDRANLLRQLADLANGPPPDPLMPVHPEDHRTISGDTATAAPPDPARPRVLRRPHLAGPGPYRPNRRQRRLLRVRAPRCEWPGCGHRAARATAPACDLDHDLAWPYGPTCACNLGPLCRRHHRIKQLGWHKQRNPDGSTRWTAPNGRTWTSPNQHGRADRAALIGIRHITCGVWAIRLPDEPEPS